MRQLSACCPCFTYEDNDSLDRQSSLAVQGEQLEMASAHKKITSKKIDRRVEAQLQRQQSKFFRTNPALEGLINRGDMSMLSSSRRQLPSLNRSAPSYQSRIKLAIKPQLNKISTTMDEQSSRGEYVAEEEESIDQDKTYTLAKPSKYEKNPLNITISHPPPTFLLDKEYRTAKNQETKPNRKQTEQEALQISSRVQTEGNEDLYSQYIDIAINKLEVGDYDLSFAYFQKLLQLLKDPAYSNRDSFKPHVLAGCCALQLQKASQALIYLLKALRLQTSQKGPHSIRLIEVYYWLGQAYFSTKKQALSKDYFSKAFRLYKVHDVQEPHLFASICLQLGKANHLQEEYAQADRFYEMGLEATQECENVGMYLELVLKSAQNQFEMDNFKATLSWYSRLFKCLKLYHGQDDPFFNKALQSLSESTQKMSDRKLSEDELKGIVEAVEQLAPGLELSNLKSLLTRPRGKSKC